MQFFTGHASRQKILLYQILDILLATNSEYDVGQDNTASLKEIATNLLKSGPTTVEKILNEMNSSAIIFESCNGKLKYNTTVFVPNASKLILIAFNENTVLQVFYSGTLASVDLNRVNAFDLETDQQKQVAEALFMQAEILKDQTLQCKFDLGSSVALKSMKVVNFTDSVEDSNSSSHQKHFIFCGAKESKAILLDSALKYIEVPIENVEPNTHQLTTEKELETRFNEVLKYEQYPVFFTNQVVNFEGFISLNN